ncbi:MAG: hypothetical protein ABIK15_01105 [Pseudomonadota bacterium]
MNLIVNLLYIAGAGVIIMIILNIINILQAGSKKPDGRTMEQILGVKAEKATYDDVEKLSRNEKMQLFYAASTPDLHEFNGEYEARLLSGGVLGKSSAFFTHHVFPFGKLSLNTKWGGKGFQSAGPNSGIGYNLFTQGNGKTLRIRKNDTSIVPTKIGKDGKRSFQINYSRLNTGMIHSMRDEVRKINDNLYIGAGYMGLGGGSLNPAPFALIGPPKPWVGADN